MGDERWQRLLGWLRGENVDYDLEPHMAVAEGVLEAAPALRPLPDQGLAERLAALTEQLAVPRSAPTAAIAALDEAEEARIEAFALVFEAARRALGLEAHPEQLAAAAAMSRGAVVEMQTGEGKTLAAVFTATFFALAGRGVHLLVPNDYLARRDAEWMGPVYQLLGLEVAALTNATPRGGRRTAYRAAVTYATAVEVGFDLLRDDLVRRRADFVMRGIFTAIYDDIDSILIDEARHPLVVAGEEDRVEAPRTDLARLARELERGRDYDTDEVGRSAYLTEAGAQRVEAELGCGDLFGGENLELLTQVNLALHAEVLVKRDADYLVRDGAVVRIDEQRGRVALGRRWPHGLQGAIEDKEGLDRTAPTRMLATTTLQATARLYPRRAGMSATVYRVADELGALYGTPVVHVPSHRECIRDDLADAVFTHDEARDRALLEGIAETHEQGRPVLVGTADVEASEQLAAALRERGTDCEVLNAKNDEREAEIIAHAGELGSVTISTNMAGRGTDIRLGGPDEADHQRVAQLGGLCVLGRERSQSGRIDDQLRGRAGRQGDPGSSQLFVSLDDDLIERHGVRELLPVEYQKARQDEPIDDKKVRAQIDRAQRIVAGRNANVRRTLWSSESYLEKQRRIIQRRRRRWLLGRGETILAEAAPERYEAELARLGQAGLYRVEGQLTLAWIDRGWAGHLERIADLRESLQLMALGVSIGTAFGRQRPLDTLRRLARDSFEEMEYEIDEGIVDSFENAELSERGVDLQALGLSPPRRTWTYLLEEQPLETKPKLRLVPSLLQSMVNKVFGRSPPSSS